MQGLLQDKEYQKERARKNFKAWKERNRDLYLERKRDYARKKRAAEREFTYDPTHLNHNGTRSGPNHSLLTTKTYEPSPIELCICGKKYLQRLGCLWCNTYYGTSKAGNNQESRWNFSTRRER